MSMASTTATRVSGFSRPLRLLHLTTALDGSLLSRMQDISILGKYMEAAQRTHLSNIQDISPHT